MKQLKKDLKNGMSKDEAFANLINRNGDQRQGSRILALYPEPQYAQKYNTANKILIIIYSLLSLFAILGLLINYIHLSFAILLFLFTIGALLPAVVIYLLYKKNAAAYIFLAFLLIKGMIDVFRQKDQSIILVSIIINLILLIFVVILKYKLFPYQNFFNTKKDANGIYVYKYS
jgi:hypothetical protein